MGMLFPAAAASALPGAAMATMGPAAVPGLLAGGAALAPSALGAGAGLAGLMGNPLFKMGTSMLMGQMGGQEQPPFLPMAPPAPPPMMPPQPPPGLAEAASAIPQVQQPGVSPFPMAPPGYPPIPYMPGPSYGSGFIRG